MRFKDKKVLVTGGGRGIGAETARQFAAEGAEVYVASRSVKEMESVAAGASGRIHCVPTDLADVKQIDHLFTEVGDSLDVLVNCAATLTNKPFLDWSLEEYDRQNAVNVRAVWYASQLAFQRMKRTGGAIVNVSSIAGIANSEKFEGFAPYVASKFAVTGMTEALAVEGKPYGISVSAVAPGAVNTRMLSDAAPFLEAGLEPKDIAEAILFLASSKKHSGSVLPVWGHMKG